MRQKRRQPIDELRVRRARQQLDEIATAHPELVDHTAPRWTDNLDELERLTNGEAMPRTTKREEKTVMVNFRLEPSLIARIDEHARRLGEATPGVTFTRIDALRALLVPALDTAERAAKGKGR